MIQSVNSTVTIKAVRNVTAELVEAATMVDSKSTTLDTIINKVITTTGDALIDSKGNLTVGTVQSVNGMVSLTAVGDITIQHFDNGLGNPLTPASVIGKTDVIAMAGHDLIMELGNTPTRANITAQTGKVDLQAQNSIVVADVLGHTDVSIKASTANIANTGDLTAITVTAQTGNVTLSANHDVTIKHDLGVAGNVTAAGSVTATAGNNLTVELASSALSAGGGATVNAATNVSLAAVNHNLTAYNVLAGNNAGLSAGNNLQAVTVTATNGAATLTTTTGDLTILHDTGKAVAGGPSVLTSGNVTAKGDATLTAGNNLTIELDSVAGGLTLGASVTSQTGAAKLIATNNVTANKVSATVGSATLTAGNGKADGLPGDLLAITVSAGTDATLSASHNLTIAHDQANPPSGVRGSVIATNDAILHAGNDLTVELATAANVPGSLVQSVNHNATLTAGHDITAATVTAGLDASLTAAHNLTADVVTGAHNGSLTATTGDITSTTSVTATANDATLTAGHTVSSVTVTAGHDAKLTGTSGDVNNTVLVHAANDATLQAGVNVATVTVTAGHNASLTGSAGDVTSTLLVQAGADASLTAGHTVNSVTVTAGHDAKLTGTSGDVNNTLLVNATNDATLLGGVNVATVTVTAGHDASLTGTTGNVTSTLLVQAGTDASLTAGVNIMSNVVTAPPATRPCSRATRSPPTRSPPASSPR